MPRVIKYESDKGIFERVIKYEPDKGIFETRKAGRRFVI